MTAAAGIEGSPLADNFDYEALPSGTPLSANLLAGAFAGIMEHTVMYPIDAIKTRMQVVNPSPAAIYNGISHALTRISASEGARTLWKGMTSVVLGAGPAHAVYFGTYEIVRNELVGDQRGAHTLATGAAGACATIASDALMNPFDVVKQRMQIHGSVHTSVSSCAKAIYKNEGLRAFYISYPTTLTMTIPFTAFQFAAYEFFTKKLNPNRHYDPLSHVASGGLAGAVAAAVTTPVDVIKTLLQTRGSATDDRIRRCDSFTSAANVIYEKEGWRGFLRGLRPRVVTSMPSTAICWASYEAGKEIWRRYGRSL
ncbi:putative mitochondrial carrier [Neolecta irregularis DAH-3]|uniref:Putative mitochondrial carrier n=1 Tax=Neolecta irregularis (strain DAH-3) TaxID=1198029 RepID=A0A1U7LIK6_NEOID|nr:putative mitochondrial carrier [Neolecta irregularis DAH-3]|eukprot:OLL22496.1 putative mitochondrial carrier [Neolecta irregularis DAH-3]